MLVLPGPQQGSLFIILTLIYLNAFLVPLNKGGPDVKVISCHMNGKIKTEEGTRKKAGASVKLLRYF